MATLMFMGRFASKVTEGTKPHTIRPKRKRRIKVGDALSLRKWSGTAYRSTQIVLRESICVRVSDVMIFKPRNASPSILIDGLAQNARAAEVLAVNDGFSSKAEMLAWFEQTHGLPFRGDLIEWSVDE
ncbi:MAG: ASCH domain-containing protein [Pirellulales bacterium]